MISNFFQANTYLIDEKVNFFKFANAYKIYNENGDQLGQVEQKLSAGAKILRLLLNKAMLPFKFDIVNANGTLEASITRGWTFWMTKINILDASGNLVGKIRQKFAFLKATFIIETADGQEIARIVGDWKAWNFSITDTTGTEIGTISKKWNGVMKEVFTSADKYIVDLIPAYNNSASQKMAVLTAAITIDMVLKERK
jgi:uncharacterized protein YxjI